MVQDLRRERDVTITMLQGMMISQTETAIDRAIGGMKVVRRIGLALAVVRMFALVSLGSRPDLANAAVSLASSEVGRIQARSGPVPGRRRGDSDRSGQRSTLASGRTLRNSSTGIRPASPAKPKIGQVMDATDSEMGHCTPPAIIKAASTTGANMNRRSIRSLDSP